MLRVCLQYTVNEYRIQEVTLECGDEFVEEVAGIDGAGGGFGVELDGEPGVFLVP